MIVHVFNSSIVSGPEMLVLPALRRLGEPVSVVFLAETRRAAEARKPIEYAKSLGHTVHAIDVRGRWDSDAFVDLRSLLDRLRPRVVHAHDVKASLYVHRARKLQPGFAPALVSTHHGATAWKGKLRLYEEYYVRRVLPRFDRGLVVCRADRDSIVRRGVPAARAVIHPNGTDRPFVRPEDRKTEASRIREGWRKTRPDLPTSPNTVYVGAVSRLASEKRHDRMLRALREISDPNVVLLCFGIGPLEARLREQTRAFGLERRVFWMGYSPTVSAEMAGFDLLLCLSDGEGIPISLLEAGWAATPIFATAVGGIPDLIPSPKYGYLVGKAEKDRKIGARLREVLGDRDALARVGAAFQARVVADFSETKWLDRLKTIYAECRPQT